MTAFPRDGSLVLEKDLPGYRRFIFQRRRERIYDYNFSNINTKKREAMLRLRKKSKVS